MRRALNKTWRRRVPSRVEPVEPRLLLAVIYVDDTAAGPARDGATWATAYADVQAALNAAASTPGADEIRVAAGTYQPTAWANGADARSATFGLQSGVSILGGYPEGGGTAAQRNPGANTTVLSGDLGAPGSAADNAYHVVTARGVDRTAALDGFTVRGGNADATGEFVGDRWLGGGMYNTGASPTVTRCTFRDNAAGYGGGMANHAGSSPTLVECTFADNYAAHGAGMYNTGGSFSTLTRCTFSGNAATQGGGGIINGGASLALTDCTFSNNTADWGGGMDTGGGGAVTLAGCTFRSNLAGQGGGMNAGGGGALTLTGCTFTANWSNTEPGGGIHNAGSDITLTGCTFSRNVAPRAPGGGMYNNGSSPTLVGCAFAGNSALGGGGMRNAGTSPTIINCTFGGNTALGGPGGAISNEYASPSLINSIVWGNTSGEGGRQIADAGTYGRSTVRRSIVQGGWAGEGNLSEDPRFVRNPTGGSAEDLRLRGGSPAIDAGDTAAVPAGVTVDAAGRPRVTGPAVDMGAYEYQPPAVIYVDDTAAGPARDGASWATAYTSVQAALDAAAASAGEDEIRVAAGIYRPTARTAAADPRSATFGLQPGITLLGGFPDGGGTVAQRDPSAHVATLSGDIGVVGSSADNTYRVLVGFGGTLDGVAVTGGNGGQGGGVYIPGGTVRDEGDPGVGASPTFINCTFKDNTADFGGGAYSAGGGFQAQGSSPTFVNCVFVNNSARWGGGGMYNAGGEADLADGATVTVINCTFAGNAADFGGGMINGSGERGVSGASSVRVINSILWGNRAADPTSGPEIAYDPDWGSTAVYHSIVQGGWNGAGSANHDADPRFVRDPSDGLSGDLRLRPGSPAIDAGDTAAVPAGVATDAAGLPRVVGPAVDIGAYEYRPSEDEVVYEAEQAAVTGATVSSVYGGFTGAGYVDFAQRSGDAVEFTVNAPSAGRYDLTFRYANGGLAARLVALSVDGAAVPSGVSFTPTGSWRTWTAATVTVPLAGGAHAVRLLATGQGGPNLDSLSIRPAAPPPAVTYQAESATLSGPLALSNVPGYTGTGFADYQRRAGDFVEFAVDVPAEGRYSLDFRYANGGTTDRALDLSLDGRVLNSRVSFAPTGAWSAWNTASRATTLAAGRHTVRVTAAGFSGPNLDALTVRTEPQPTTLQAEAATLSGPLVASHVPGFTGSGYADYQRGTGDSIEFAYEAPSAGQYLLEFRYANGGTADRPLELSVDGAVARSRLSFAPTGRWSAWGTASATVALQAGVNRIKLASIGLNGPNLDALAVTPAATV